MELIFMRHGECITNTAKYLEGQYAYNFLTLRGAKQAELAAEELRDHGRDQFDYVYTSTVLRAMQTANIVLQTLDLHSTTPCTQFHQMNEWWEGSETPLEEYREIVSGFFFDHLKPLWNESGKALIVGHGNQMRVLFEIMDLHAGKIPSLRNGKPRSINIPNAMPFIYDTAKQPDFKYLIPGEHSQFYATK